MVSHIFSYYPISFPTIPSHFPQSHLISHNLISFPTIPSNFPQSHLISHNPISFPTIPSHFPQSHLISHNPISFPTIPSHFPISHLFSRSPISFPTHPLPWLSPCIGIFTPDQPEIKTIKKYNFRVSSIFWASWNCDFMTNFLDFKKTTWAVGRPFWNNP